MSPFSRIAPNTTCLTKKAPYDISQARRTQEKFCSHFFLGSTQSLVDTKKQQRPAIKQGTPCDGVWRDQPWSSVGALSTKL